MTTRTGKHHSGYYMILSIIKRLININIRISKSCPLKISDNDYQIKNNFSLKSCNKSYEY